MLLAIMVGAYNWGTPEPWVLVVAPVLMLIRSMFFGVYVDGAAVKIVSWYWTYFLARSAVRDVRLRNYNGWVNRWSGGIDIFTANVLMIVFVLESGRERPFPATAMRHSTAKHTLEDLRSRLGMVGLSRPPRRQHRRDTEEIR
jgi:hypothetical protein